MFGFFFFSSRRRHTRLVSDWSSDVCSSDLLAVRLEVDARLGINNINRQGLEVTQKRTDDLREINIKSPSALQPAMVPVLAGDLYGDYYEIRFSDFSRPYLQLTGLRCKIAKSGCSDKVIGLTVTKENELDFVLTDPNYKPDYKWVFMF